MVFGCGKKSKAKKIVRQALADNVLTEEEIKQIDEAASKAGLSKQEISEIRQAHYMAAIQPVLNRVKRARRFSLDDEAEIQKLSENLHVVPDFAPLVPYRKLWEIETTGIFEPEPIDVEIRLGKNEQCYYVCQAVWAQIKTKRARTGYVGGSVGVRVAKGVTLRFGKAVPTYDEREEMTDISGGDLYVTNKKLIFDGDQRSTNITYGRLVNYELFTDGIGIKKTSGKPDFFRMDAIDIEFVDALLQTF